MKRLLLPILLISSLLSEAQQIHRQKVIFDCDLGDDIDDAYALAYLLTLQDRYEVLGITTCYGRTEDRANLAKKFLETTGQDHIPVFAGRNTSSSSERANWYAGQFYWAEEFRPRTALPEKKAADFIYETLNRYPGEVIVFSVGPVTNFHDVLKRDPNVLKKAKKIYAMFGSFHTGYNNLAPVNAEWNVVCDVAAARAFVNSGADIVYAGLDVTAMVKWDKPNRERLLYRQSPLTDALSALYVLWENETPTLFDPVAIGMALHPDLFKTGRGHVEVDDKGFTRLNADGVPNATIGLSIDAGRFLELLAKSYLQQDLHPE